MEGLSGLVFHDTKEGSRDVPRKAAVQISGENVAEVESYQNKVVLTKVHLVADQN